MVMFVGHFIDEWLLWEGSVYGGQDHHWAVSIGLYKICKSFVPKLVLIMIYIVTIEINLDTLHNSDEGEQQLVIGV